jgi:uncharacterized protein YjbI with pentapeptide repeats
MQKTKRFVIIAVAIILTASTVLAKKMNCDFDQEDYNALLKGERHMVRAKLEEANLQGMDLRGRDFSHAELEGANFEKADLSRAIFRHADLEEANFKDAKITGTIFKGAKLGFATWVDGRMCAEDSLGSCW